MYYFALGHLGFHSTKISISLQYQYVFNLHEQIITNEMQH